MEIEVTAALIRCGQKNSNGLCPIGLAVRKATGKRMKMIGPAMDDQTFIILAGEERIYYTTKCVMEFVYAFDMGKPVQPLRFALGDYYLSVKDSDEALETQGEL